MNDDTFKSIERKLDVLIGLTAHLATKDMTVTDGAPLLRRLGMSPAEIAPVLKSTAKAVKTRIKEAKKKATNK